MRSGGGSAGVTQLVEFLISNQNVEGSSPFARSNYIGEEFETIWKTQSKINILSYGVVNIFNINRILDSRNVIRQNVICNNSSSVYCRLHRRDV